MLFVELITDHFNKIENINNKNSLCYYINPITDINILKHELKELQQVNKNINVLDKDINYLSLFNNELEYMEEIHKQYNKTDVIFNNNQMVIIDKDFKKYCSLIKRELKSIIKQLENKETTIKGKKEKRKIN